MPLALPIDRARLRAWTDAGVDRVQVAARCGVTVHQLLNFCRNHRLPYPVADTRASYRAELPPKVRQRAKELRDRLADPPAEALSSTLAMGRPSGLPPLPRPAEARAAAPVPPAGPAAGVERPLGWLRRVTITIPDPATGGRRPLYLDTDSAAGVDAAVTFGCVFGFPVHLADAPAGAEPCRVDLGAAERH